MKLLVTSYTNPDLDGVACTLGYAEFLQKNGKGSIAAIFGNPHREARFVLRKFNIPDLPDADKIIDEVDGIIIVDTSNLRSLSTKIDPQKVIEVIDHRKVHEAHEFPNAKIQIELVGSAATLIAEKFYNTNAPISMESAALLYSAIVSNTINFQAKVTTERDRKMADWLKDKYAIPDNYVRNMFLDKSHFTKPLKETMADDFVVFHINGRSLGIAQLEIVDVDEFIRANHDAIIGTLTEFKAEKSLDLVFLTCIDVEKAFNQIVVIDNETKELIDRALSIEVKGDVGRTNGIFMRKEIVPLIKGVLEEGVTVEK